MNLTLSAPAKSVWHEYDEALLWVGIALLGEPATSIRLACIALIVAGIAGLKIVS